MDLMNRRGFLRSVVGGGAVVAMTASAGVALLPSAAEAAPVPADKSLPEAMERWAENVQYRRRYYRPHYYRGWGPRYGYWRRRRRRYWRRRRRWACWWRRGRRVCGWRYW